MREKLKFVFPVRYLYSLFPQTFRTNYKYYAYSRKLIRETERKTIPELRDLQFSLFQKIAVHAWDNIPGYRDHWTKQGFHISQLKIFEDIIRIPLINKDTLLENIEQFSCKSFPDIKKVSTGGSTGIPFSFYMQEKESMTEKGFIHAQWARNYPEISLRTKSTILRGRKMGSDIHFDPIYGLVLSSFDLTPENIAVYARAIDRYKTPILQAYPSSLYLFTRGLIDQNIRLDHHFEAIMLGSEMLYDYQRALFSDFYKTKLNHWYGHGERTILAGNCESSDSLHVYPQYGLFELVDAKGQPVPENTRGEIVGTSFWNYATPFIRYRTYDYAEKGPDHCVYCGRNHQIINKLDGRYHEFIVSKNKKLIALTSVSIICGWFTELQQFRFYQDTIGKIELQFIKKPGISSINKEVIRKALLEKIGNEYEISFKEVQSLKPTASGKLMYLDQKLNIESIIAEQNNLL
jgi:phenylacetate-CoA ligase